jgi:nicotinamide-nucleotide amidase
MSNELAKAGYRVARHTVLPDDAEALESGLKEALARSLLVLTTGGLGPTCDDLTKRIAAKIFDSPLERDEALFEELKKKYGEARASFEDQALIPTKAKRLLNAVGTASGFFFSEKGHSLALLPGPPREMMPMLTEILLPELPQLLGIKPQSAWIQTAHLCFLREDEVDPLLRELEEEYPNVTVVFQDMVRDGAILGSK